MEPVSEEREDLAPEVDVKPGPVEVLMCEGVVPSSKAAAKISAEAVTRRSEDVKICKKASRLR